MTVSTTTSVVVDRSTDSEFLRIDFNLRYISFGNPFFLSENFKISTENQKADCTSLDLILQKDYFLCLIVDNYAMFY